ncbi:serine hydrolase domain-containing protein [Chelativorans salis]|uniref:Serine hydrolase n=1 Tax=Chelativorans salis TaxID=2978478 RepID=A0ABT2LTT8_9HYPH|nr:serine hydrolase domain-containing protein [Chelativorans sp. EGI FJ00035]MCT7377948.1 serine hydrolase [Chelativorans sp. EGI FJ00035]
MTDMTDQIDHLFAAWAKLDSPGAAVAVMQDGEIVLKRGYGMANLDHDVPIEPSSIFHAASVSKQFTAMAVYMLAGEGKLTLEDDARSYIPQLPDLGFPITLRHLLHHTSGLRDQWDLLTLAGWRYSKDLITDDDVLRLVSRQRTLNFPPGARFLYCNTGYTLLAQVVQNVTGQSFRQFTTSRLFKALGMARTFFRDRHGEVIKGVAYGYHPCGEGFEAAPTNFETVGATSLLTTVEDLALWDANFYSGLVGGKSVFDQMHQRGVLNDGSLTGYGGGVGLGTYRGFNIVEHTGGDAGYRSDLMRFPEQGLSIAILSNLSSIDPPALARRIADIVLKPILPGQRENPRRVPTIDSMPQLELERLAGVYIDPEDGDQILHLHYGNGKLLGGAAAAKEQAFELEPMGSGHFRYILFPRTQILVEGDGALSLLVDDRPINRFVRLASYSCSPAELEEFVGTYRSPETGYEYDVVLYDGGLASRALKQLPQPMTVMAKDLFVEGRSRLRFRRDDKGVVAGLELNSERTRNFNLDRLPSE